MYACASWYVFICIVDCVCMCVFVLFPGSCPSLCETKTTWTRQSTSWTEAPTWRASGSCCSLRSTAMWDTHTHTHWACIDRIVPLPFLHYSAMLWKIQFRHYIYITLSLADMKWLFNQVLKPCLNLLLSHPLSNYRPPPPPTTCRVSRWGSSPPSPLEMSARCTNPLSPGGATYQLVHISDCHSKFALILSATRWFTHWFRGGNVDTLFSSQKPQRLVNIQLRVAVMSHHCHFFFTTFGFPVCCLLCLALSLAVLSLASPFSNGSSSFSCSPSLDDACWTAANQITECY